MAHDTPDFIRVRHTLLSTAVSYSNTTTRLNMVTPCWWSLTLSGTSKCQMVKRALWSGSKIKSRNFKSRWFCKMQICRMEALMRRCHTTWNHFGVVGSFGVWNLRWKFCIFVCVCYMVCFLEFPKNSQGFIFYEWYWLIVYQFLWVFFNSLKLHSKKFLKIVAPWNFRRGKTTIFRGEKTFVMQRGHKATDAAGTWTSWY